MQSDSPGPRAVELFAGCGGLSLGLARAGWRALFAVERDAFAYATLSANMVAEGAPFPSFHDWPAWLPKGPRPVESLLSDPSLAAGLASLRGTVDLVAGGPPCQGFSAGGKRDASDPRNGLVHAMLDVVDALAPRAVLVENVEGVETVGAASGASVAAQALARLSAAGYGTTFAVASANRFGVPQSRRRVAIVALRGAGPSVHQAVRDALDRAARDVRRAHGLGDGPVSVAEALDDLDGPGTAPCPDSPGYRSGTYGEPASDFARAMRRGVAAGAVPDSHRLARHGEGTARLYALAHRTQAPGRLPKSFLLANGLRKDRKILLDPTVGAPTVTSHPDDFIHHRRERIVTVREMARLQSFPDAFAFRGRYTVNGERRGRDVPRCSQVGNAIPPLLAEGLARAMRSLLDA